jgi:hypothetical protein
MSNMDESTGMDEQSHGGLSRRDMIKASVVAGALVWSAPVLLSGTAYAQAERPECPCAPAGTPVRLNISGGNPGPITSANCGNVGCLIARDPSLDVACGTREQALFNCIVSAPANLMRFVAPTDKEAGLATIELDPMITVISAAFRHQANSIDCVFTDCGPDMATSQASGTNTTVTGAVRPLPNQIWVTPGGGLGGQTIHIDTTAVGQQDNWIEINLILCVSNAVTGRC